MRLTAPLLCVLSLACGNSSPKRSVEPSVEASVCSTEQLATWLDDVRADGLKPRIAYPRLWLAELDSEHPPALDLFLFVGELRVEFLNQFIGNIAELSRADLDYLRERLQEARDAPVTVAVDARVPWKQVVPILNVILDAGTRRLSLLGEHPFRAHPPRPSSLDLQVDEIAFFEETRGLHEVRKRGWHSAIYAQCPTGRALFESFESSETSLSDVLEALPKAIEACNCAVELPAVEAHVWGLVGRIRRPAKLVVSDLELAAKDSATATEVVLAPDTPWSQAVKQVVAARGPVRVRVKAASAKDGDK